MQSPDSPAGEVALQAARSVTGLEVDAFAQSMKVY